MNKGYFILVRRDGKVDTFDERCRVVKPNELNTGLVSFRAPNGLVLAIVPYENIAIIKWVEEKNDD